MGYYLTPEQLAYGKQHLRILTSNASCPNGMSRSKLAVSGGNPTPIGINYNSWINGYWDTNYAGLFGQFMGWWGSNTESQSSYLLATLKHFVPVRVDWYWHRNGKGWATRGHTLRYVNNGNTIVMWSDGVRAGAPYSFTIPDNLLLSWNLSSPTSYLQMDMFARNNNGTFGGIVQVTGFQTPYPNKAVIVGKDKIHKPLQIVGYKDDKGQLHTAGRLL